MNDDLAFVERACNIAASRMENFVACEVVCLELSPFRNRLRTVNETVELNVREFSYDDSAFRVLGVVLIGCGSDCSCAYAYCCDVAVFYSYDVGV